MNQSKKNQVLVVVDGNYALMGFSDLAKKYGVPNIKLDIEKLKILFETIDDNSEIVFKFWFDSSDNAKDNSKWKNLIEYHGFRFPHFDFKTMNVKATCPKCDHHFVVQRSVQAGVDSAITNIIQKRCIDDPRINRLYLLAGDGDFQPIVQKVNDSFKTAYVFAFKDSFKASLKATAGSYFHLLDSDFDFLSMLPTQPSPTKPLIEINRSGDWNCSNCGDFQFGRNELCRKCGSKRVIHNKSNEASHKRKRDDWDCPQCGDYQFARNDSCRKCGFIKF